MIPRKIGRNAVLKLTFCLRRLRSLSLAEFQDYWLNKHGPLVRRLQPALGMVRYVQVHRLDGDLADGMRRVRDAPEPYDGVGERGGLPRGAQESAGARGRPPAARRRSEVHRPAALAALAQPGAPRLWRRGRAGMKRLILILLAILPAVAATAADTYPSRPIKLVVGFAPGGGNDLIARIVSARLQEKLGQPVLVDNKPGAQGIIAAELVAKAPSDGYTLLVAPSGTMTVNPAVYAKLNYAPERDFAPISLLAEFPLLLAVGAEQPVKSVRELIEYGRAHPNLANY